MLAQAAQRRRQPASLPMQQPVAQARVKYRHMASGTLIEGTVRLAPGQKVQVKMAWIGSGATAWFMVPQIGKRTQYVVLDALRGTIELRMKQAEDEGKADQARVWAEALRRL